MRKIIFLENDDLNRHDNSGVLATDGSSDRVKGNRDETSMKLKNSLYSIKYSNKHNDKEKMRPYDSKETEHEGKVDLERGRIADLDSKYADARRNKRMY